MGCPCWLAALWCVVECGLSCAGFCSWCCTVSSTHYYGVWSVLLLDAVCRHWATGSSTGLRRCYGQGIHHQTGLLSAVQTFEFLAQSECSVRGALAVSVAVSSAMQFSAGLLALTGWQPGCVGYCLRLNWSGAWHTFFLGVSVQECRGQ